jgi:hypothetical protein
VKLWIPFAVIVLAIVGYGGYRLYQYQEWKAAYGKALDAYKRAYDYRDAGTLLYEPRRKDFDAAMDDLERQPIPGSYAGIDRNLLRYCGDDLEIYRQDMRLLDRLDLKQTPKAEIDRDMDNLTQAGKLAGACIRNAASNGDL